jgi:hypothetical protein
MKNTTIKIENHESSIQFDLTTNNTKDDAKVRRALVYRFFDYYNTMRIIGAKGFKASEPFKISFVVDGKIAFTTTQCTTQAQTTLKLINNPKGRAKFEMRLDNIIALAQRLGVNSTEQVIKQVEETLMAVK